MARNVLISLTEAEFKEVVNNDLRDAATRTQYKALRTPEAATRWLLALQQTKRNVESQFAAARTERIVKTAEFAKAKKVEVVTTPPRGPQPAVTEMMTELEFAAHQEKWRAGAVRFLTNVEERIAEAKVWRESVKIEEKINLTLMERDDLFKQVLKLRNGILTHRQTVTEDEESSAEADDTLWALVEQ